MPDKSQSFGASNVDRMARVVTRTGCFGISPIPRDSVFEVTFSDANRLTLTVREMTNLVGGGERAPPT